MRRWTWWACVGGVMSAGCARNLASLDVDFTGSRRAGGLVSVEVNFDGPGSPPCLEPTLHARFNGVPMDEAVVAGTADGALPHEQVCVNRFRWTLPVPDGTLVSEATVQVLDGETTAEVRVGPVDLQLVAPAGLDQVTAGSALTFLARPPGLTPYYMWRMGPAGGPFNRGDHSPGQDGNLVVDVPADTPPGAYLLDVLAIGGSDTGPCPFTTCSFSMRQWQAVYAITVR